MTLITGIAIVALALFALIYSRPHKGKSARFVGSFWEGYIVVGMVGLLGVGIITVIVGAVALEQ